MGASAPTAAANRLDGLDISRQAGLDLESRESVGRPDGGFGGDRGRLAGNQRRVAVDRLGAIGSEQPPDRLAAELAGEVEEREVDSAESLVIDAFRAALVDDRRNRGLARVFVAERLGIGLVKGGQPARAGPAELGGDRAGAGTAAQRERGGLAAAGRAVGGDELEPDQVAVGRSSPRAVA